MKMINRTDVSVATGPSGVAKPTLSSSSRTRRLNAPIWIEQGTALPVGGSATAAAVAPAALVAHAGARSTDLPGSPPRGAPV